MHEKDLWAQPGSRFSLARISRIASREADASTTAVRVASLNCWQTQYLSFEEVRHVYSDHWLRETMACGNCYLYCKKYQLLSFDFGAYWLSSRS